VQHDGGDGRGGRVGVHLLFGVEKHPLVGLQGGRFVLARAETGQFVDAAVVLEVRRALVDLFAEASNVDCLVGADGWVPVADDGNVGHLVVDFGALDLFDEQVHDVIGRLGLVEVGQHTGHCGAVGATVDELLVGPVVGVPVAQLVLHLLAA